MEKWTCSNTKPVLAPGHNFTSSLRKCRVGFRDEDPSWLAATPTHVATLAPATGQRAQNGGIFCANPLQAWPVSTAPLCRNERTTPHAPPRPAPDSVSVLQSIPSMAKKNASGGGAAKDSKSKATAESSSSKAGADKDKPGKLKAANSINVRHILCEKHGKKEEALEKLRNGAKFDDVAREMSEDKARQGSPDEDCQLARLTITTQVVRSAGRRAEA